MIRSLQSLRFVFIMLVVMSHVIGKSFDFGGECGVSFFFMLSGFILSYAYGERVQDGTFRHRRFLVRQLLKFYPLHLLTFLVMALLDARLGQMADGVKLLANVLLLQSWVPSDSFYFVANGSSWFLSDLLFFYLVFPAVLRLLLRVSRRVLAVMGLVVLVLYALLAAGIPQQLINPLLYASPATRLLDFSIGIVLFRLYRSAWGRGVLDRASRLKPSSLTLYELLLVAAVVLSFFVYGQSSPRFRCAALFWMVLPVVLLSFAATDRLRGRVTMLLHHPLMQWLGSISFEIYLTHWVTMRVLLSVLASLGHAEGGLLQPVNFLLTMVAVIGTSYVAKRCYVDVIYARLSKTMSL